MENTSTPQVTCPVCGSTQIQAVNVGGATEYDAVDGVCAGVLGAICLGPIGLIFALCGLKDKKEDKLVRMCLNCGHQF